MYVELVEVVGGGVVGGGGREGEHGVWFLRNVSVSKYSWFDLQVVQVRCLSFFLCACDESARREEGGVWWKVLFVDMMRAGWVGDDSDGDGGDSNTDGDI